MILYPSKSPIHRNCYFYGNLIVDFCGDFQKQFSLTIFATEFDSGMTFKFGQKTQGILVVFDPSLESGALEQNRFLQSAC